MNKFSGETFSQSFNINGTGASILLNDWTFAVTEPPFDPESPNVPLFSTPILNIYEGNGLLRGSATAVNSSVTLAGFTAAKWTFAGAGLSLLDNQTYTAAVSSGTLKFEASNVDVYANGFLTSSDSVSASFLGTNYDTVFQANYSSAPTAVPFEFEPTGGLLVLGGGWLLRRHLKKRATKVK